MTASPASPTVDAPVPALAGCRRVLVIVYGHLGDTMAATPALRSLRAALPGCRIDVLGLRCARPILEGSPHLDRLIEWGDFRRKGSPLSRLEKAALIPMLAARLRPGRYDATIVLHNGTRSMRALADAVGSRIRAGLGYGSEPLHRLVPSAAQAESARHENARILAALGVVEDGGPVELPTSPADVAAARALLGEGPGPLIGIHAGADWSCQQWLPERFAAVATALHDHARARIVLTGSSNELALQAEIVRAMPRPPITATGRTSFGALVEVIRRLDLLVSVSSAPASIADAVGTPSVVLFGPEDSRYTGTVDGPIRRVLQPGGSRPAGSWCELGRWGMLSGCESPACRGLLGLDRLTAAEVTAVCLELLGAPASAARSSPRPGLSRRLDASR